jgi:hypothetical protein
MTVNNFYEQSDKNQQDGPGGRVAFGHIADQKSGIARFLGLSVGVLSAAMSAVLSAACHREVSGMSASPQTSKTHPQSVCGFSATGGGMILRVLKFVTIRDSF